MSDFTAATSIDVKNQQAGMAIQKYLEDPLAEEIWNMNIKNGDMLVAEINETGE